MSSFSTAVTDITAKVASLLFVFSRSIGHALSHGLKRRHRPFPSIWHSMAARSCDHLDFFSIFWPASLKDQLNSSDGIVNYRSPSRSELLILVASEWSHLSFSFTFDGLLSPRPENPAIICIRSFNCPKESIGNVKMSRRLGMDKAPVPDVQPPPWVQPWFSSTRERSYNLEEMQALQKINWI